MVANGAMSLVRDEHLIFHGCVPCDAAGTFLPMPLGGGRTAAGRPLFEEIQRVVLRVPQTRSAADLDLMWYLWSGPRSPLFGKDRIATFERDFIADKGPHHEERDPYFGLIHEAWFCETVLAAFGVDPARGLIVNGHVPVKVQAGESPVKRSGKAITIDGAFSEAYGDHGYTLVLEADRTLLAQHYHFESVESAIRDGVDIVPTVPDHPRVGPPADRGRRRPGPRPQGQGGPTRAARRGVPHRGRPRPRRLRGVPLKARSPRRRDGTTARSEGQAERKRRTRLLSRPRGFVVETLLSPLQTCPTRNRSNVPTTWPRNATPSWAWTPTRR